MHYHTVNKIQVRLQLMFWTSVQGGVARLVRKLIMETFAFNLSVGLYTYFCHPPECSSSPPQKWFIPHQEARREQNSAPTHATFTCIDSLDKSGITFPYTWFHFQNLPIQPNLNFQGSKYLRITSIYCKQESYIYTWHAIKFPDDAILIL